MIYYNSKSQKAQAGTKTSMSDHGSDLMTNIMHGISTLGMSTVGDAISGFSPRAAAAVEKYSLGMIPYTHQESRIANRSSSPNYKANRVSSVAGALNGAAAGVLTGGVLKAVIPRIVKGTASKFVSDVEWAKWNKEIPANKSLLKEYHRIEKNSKASGNWLKNKDGSEFRGSEEQFVQQQSKNFKKAFPDMYTPDGNFQPLHHASNAEFTQIDPTKFGRTDPGWYGKGTYLAPSKDYSQSYGEVGYEFYANSKNKLSSLDTELAYRGSFKRELPTKSQYEAGLKADIDAAINKGHLQESSRNSEYERQMSAAFENPYNPPVHVKEYADPDIIKWQNSHDLMEVTHFKGDSPHEIVVPFESRMKSSKNNNGMFDMSNPNIYKAVAPIALTTGAYAKTRKRNGGILYK